MTVGRAHNVTSTSLPDRSSWRPCLMELAVTRVAVTRNRLKTAARPPFTEPTLWIRQH